MGKMVENSFIIVSAETVKGLVFPLRFTHLMPNSNAVVTQFRFTKMKFGGEKRREMLLKWFMKTFKLR